MSNKYNDSSIVSLDGLQHIRFRSGAYGFHPNDPAGIQLLVTEILHNSIDEAKLDLRKAQRIDIVFHRLKDTFQCVVLDTGRGVPLKRIKAVFTQPNTSGKWQDEYVGSAGAHGVGVKSSPALSRHFVACSKRKEGYANVATTKAKVVNTGLVTIPARKRTDLSGTIVAVEPDPSVMPNAKLFFDKNGPYDNIVDYINFVAASLKNTEFRVFESTVKLDLSTLINDNPISTWDKLAEYIDDSNLVLAPEKGHTASHYLLENEHSNITWDSGELIARDVKVPVTIQSGLKKKTHASMNLMVQLMYTGKSSVMGSVNMVRINDKTSSHLKAFIRTIKSKLAEHVDSKMLEFFNSSYQLPLNLISLAEYQHAVFVNQDKSRFVDNDFEAGFGSTLTVLFSDLPEEKWLDLFELIKPDLLLRWSKKQRRGLRMSNDDKNLAFTLNNPRCFFECKNTGAGTELLICEGVSSGDWVKVNRDIESQAVFELTGKVLNSFRNKSTTIEDLAKNKVIGDMIRVLGTSPEDTDLTECRYDKIGILTDSDSDGSHIATLVLSAIWHINPALITSGKVMLLNPPLYVVKFKGNPSKFYVKNESGLTTFKSDYYSKIIGLTLNHYGESAPTVVEPKLFASLYLLIHAVTDAIIQLSNEHHVVPALGEMLVACVEELESKDMELLATKLGCDSCTLSKNGDTLYLLADGYETVVPMHGLVEHIQSSVLPMIQKYHFDKFSIGVSDADFDDLEMTLMELRDLFLRHDKLLSIKRLKGLGELDAEGLKVTCLDRETRVVTTITDIGNIQTIRALMGVDSTMRKELVMGHVE